jgi:hypothetical protein
MITLSMSRCLPLRVLDILQAVHNAQPEATVFIKIALINLETSFQTLPARVRTFEMCRIHSPASAHAVPLYTVNGMPQRPL